MASRARSRQQEIVLRRIRKKWRQDRRGYPALNQTHLLAPGGSLGVASFRDASRPVTFKLRVDFSSLAGIDGILEQAADANEAISRFPFLGQGLGSGGTLAVWDQGSIGFDGPVLQVVAGGSTFTVPVSGNPASDAEIVVSIRPSDGALRAWVDSERVIVDTTSMTGYEWITSGTLDYDSVSGVVVLNKLEIFDGQLPFRFL